ncbi:CynX/NimT family MFS transporter [Microterricola viridarii]|uniref:ABC transporter permease n=1 Tax=Microterricola viridarii TaxID=412690 RepID=A0A0Y0MYI2_9MICO|nr:MFS transporter [Microterricola viridarii]AMB58109.1 ABC transporter permease [Microterricola viridarii]
MPDQTARPLWAGRTLALLGILLVALNLRTAVAAFSPIAGQIAADIPLSPAVLGVLGMLPPVCFALFGILTPVFTRRFGLERVLIVALLAIVLGQALRGFSVSLPMLLLGSAVTFAGFGVGNVLLPPLVKKYFPDRIGLMTTLYATALSVSTFLPPLLAVPVADAAGWHFSLGMWAVFGVIALVPWLTLTIGHRPDTSELPEEARPQLLVRVWRSSIGWSLAIVFAVSSLNAYAMFAWLPALLVESAGLTPAQAGTMLSLYAAMGLPASLVIPLLAARLRHVGILVYLGVAFFIVGYLGLLLVPSQATWLWVALAGCGPLIFPLSLALINLRTRTHEGAVALSGFVQGAGYTIGAFGPLLVALLHDMTGGWTVPLLVLIGSAVVCAFAGSIVARPHMLEDGHAARR